jgi:transcriptional regulator with XRE-family HTH domain
MITTGSTVPRRRLGRELQALRKAQKLKADAVVAHLEWSRSKLWRMETGQVPVRKTDIMALALMYDVNADMLEALVALATETKQKGWWHSYGDTIPDWFQMYVGLETVADLLREYGSELVPGLLQTADYCRCVHRISSTAGKDAIEKLVSIRMERQALLTREEPAAPQLDFFLNEAVIRRPIGGREVMLAQYRRLLEATDLPNVEIRVLPFAAGEHAALAGSFIYLSFPEKWEPDVVYLESQTGAAYLDNPKQLTKYKFILRNLEDRSLDAKKSRAFIAIAAKEM